MNKDKPKVGFFFGSFAKCWPVLAEQWEIGANKHGANSYRENDMGLFLNAMARHHVKVQEDYGSIDKDDGFFHATANAFNALIVLDKLLREMEDKSNALNEMTEQAEELELYETKSVRDEPSLEEPLGFDEWAIDKGCKYDEHSGQWYDECRFYSERNLREMYEQYRSDFEAKHRRTPRNEAGSTDVANDPPV